MWRDFNFFRLTDRQTDDGQTNRLLNPASRMRARGNNLKQYFKLLCSMYQLSLALAETHILHGK